MGTGLLTDVCDPAARHHQPEARKLGLWQPAPLLPETKEAAAGEKNKRGKEEEEQESEQKGESGRKWVGERVGRKEEIHRVFQH